MTPDEVKTWRRSQRVRLIALRKGAPLALRRRWGEAIEASLAALFEERAFAALGVYWPFQAEFDPRALIDRFLAAGRAVALPAVVDREGPLEYRLWRPGEPLVDGVWKIPVPQRRAVIVPEAVLAPLVGFDRDCYRLGYGGGYFDRTLKALKPRPLAIGVGFELAFLETIHPLPFDVPMDRIVTEAGVRRRLRPPAVP